MYRFMLSTVLLTSLFCNAMAQGREFGIRAGIEGALTYNQGEMLGELIPSLYAGVFIGRPLGSTFFTSFISGVEYAQNGYRIEEDNYRKLHYISLPFALRIHFGPFSLQSGVNANIKVSEKLVEGGGQMLESDNRSSWFDLPIQFGAGVKIIDVTLAIRYHQGWIDINQGNKNSYLQIGLDYTF